MSQKKYHYRIADKVAENPFALVNFKINEILGEEFTVKTPPSPSVLLHLAEVGDSFQIYKYWKFRNQRLFSLSK